MPTSLCGIISRRHEYRCNGTRGEEAVKSNLRDSPKYKSISRFRFFTLVTQRNLRRFTDSDSFLFLYFLVNRQIGSELLAIVGPRRPTLVDVSLFLSLSLFGIVSRGACNAVRAREQ